MAARIGIPLDIAANAYQDSTDRPQVNMCNTDPPGEVRTVPEVNPSSGFPSATEASAYIPWAISRFDAAHADILISPNMCYQPCRLNNPDATRHDPLVATTFNGLGNEKFGNDVDQQNETDDTYNGSLYEEITFKSRTRAFKTEIRLDCDPETVTKNLSEEVTPHDNSENLNCKGNCSGQGILPMIAFQCVLLLVILGISSYPMLVNWLKWNNFNDENDQLTNSEANNTSITHIYAISLDDYKRKFHKLPSDISFNLTISLSKTTDWPVQPYLIGCTQIKRLEIKGPFSAAELVNIIYQAERLSELRFLNLNGRFCSQSAYMEPQFPKKYVNSRAIQALEILNFSKGCSTFYQTINSFVTLSHLEELKLADSVIDRKNSGFFQNILRDARLLFKKLELVNTKLLTMPLGWVTVGVMPKVTKPVIDLGSFAQNVLKKLKISYMFTNVKELSYCTKERPLPNISSISGLSKLKRLEMGILLPNSLNFSVSFLTELPKLEYASNYAVFPQCSTKISKADSINNYATFERIRKSITK